MELSEYKNIFDNEDSHFFYAANHEIILSLLKKYKPKSTVLKILDAGCGTGLLVKKLSKYGEVIGVDFHSQALIFAKKRRIKVKKASVNKLPFKDNSFDVITSVDVIYHRNVNDKKALKEFYRVLKHGGILILRVPAVKWLKLTHDQHVHTRERYNKEDLETKLLQAGFKIKKLSFVNMTLLPPAIIRHFWEKLNRPQETSSTINKVPKNINNLLTKILSWETHLLKIVDLPFGLGLVTVAQKS